MPYEGEYAQYIPLKRILESEQVKKLKERARTITQDAKERIKATTVVADIKPSQYVPDFVIAIDGSCLPVMVENGFPGAEMGCITVASVLLDLAKMRELDEQRPADPRKVRETRETSSIEKIVPGANVVVDEEASADASLRKVLFEVFSDTRVSDKSESLLDTYEALLKYKKEQADEKRRQKCPYGYKDNDDSCFKTYEPRSGAYTCSCDKKLTLYSTDALRVYENMQSGGSNSSLYTEIMQVWERIWIVHTLRTLEQRKLLPILKRLAIIVDGPLAVFGHPAWLSDAIYQELRRINDKAKHINNGLDILIIGVEKTGAFVDHFAKLDESSEGQQGILKPHTALLLNDEYIKKNVIYSDSKKVYGEATYFGRKFFYKTASGARIVPSLPFLTDAHKNTQKADIDQYPRLADALSILDQLVSIQYPNSLMPLVEAHAEAAIPLHLGTQLLEELVRKSESSTD